MRDAVVEASPRTQVVIESSSTWYGVYRILAKRHHVVLSNPGKTKAIASAKVKTDIYNEPNNSARLISL